MNDETEDKPLLYCLGCGYSLKNLTKPRCPECGKKFDFSKGKTFGRLSRSLISARMPSSIKRYFFILLGVFTLIIGWLPLYISVCFDLYPNSNLVGGWGPMAYLSCMPSGAFLLAGIVLAAVSHWNDPCTLSEKRKNGINLLVVGIAIVVIGMGLGYLITAIGGVAEWSGLLAGAISLFTFIPGCAVVLLGGIVFMQSWIQRKPDSKVTTVIQRTMRIHGAADRKVRNAIRRTRRNH